MQQMRREEEIFYTRFIGCLLILSLLLGEMVYGANEHHGNTYNIDDGEEMDQRAQLVIVIDDFGYRKSNELRLLDLNAALNIAILPNAPYTALMDRVAHEKGHNIIIHMPMEPLNFKRVEKDTLSPSMATETIEALIDDAIEKVPHAIGMNNHMGSKMTRDFKSMAIVMKRLKKHHLFFLDSVTVGGTQAKKVGAWAMVPIFERSIFLDNVQEVGAISQQLDQAIALARKKGMVIAIGHPYDATVELLESRLDALPVDIQLTPLEDLIIDYKGEKSPIKKHLNHHLNQYLEESETQHDEVK